MSTLRATLPALAFLLALAACGQGGGKAPAATTEWPSFDQPAASASKVPKAALPPACTLVTAAQAEALLQQPVSLMSEEPENCIWASAGNPGQITMLMVNLVPNDDLAMAQTVFNSLTGLQGKLSGAVNSQLGEKTRKSGQELEALGDEAWISGNHMDLIASKQLVARKGTLIFNLNVTGMSKTGQLEGFDARLIALAQSAVPRL